MEEELRSDLKDVLHTLRTDRGTCPEVEQLLAYGERTPGARETHPIHHHVSVCSRCQLILMKAAEPEVAETRSSFRWGIPALVAASVLLAIIGPIAYRTFLQPPPEETIRGTEIQLLAPVGSVGPAAEFKWQSPIRNVVYRINIYKDGRIFSDTTPQTTYAIPEAVQTGTDYTWDVEAIDSAGSVRMRSPRVAFSLSR